jgi:hypothetical protein
MVARRAFSRLLLALALQAALPAVTNALPNIRLTSDASSSARPRVALDPQANVVVVWQDGRFGNDEILWQKFDQLGNPLTAVVRVTNTAGASRYPDARAAPMASAISLGRRARTSCQWGPCTSVASTPQARRS